MTTPTTGAIRAGRLISALVALTLFADGVVGLLVPQLLAAEAAATGFPAALLRPVGLIALVCAVLYAIPRTSVIGAILATGFLGGAICTHFRLGEVGSPPQIVCLVLGVLAWAGLVLRDPRLRAFVPLAA